MIAFFPELYEDELLYSWFARFYVQSGHLSYRATAEDLFQNKDVIPSPEFIVPLNQEAYNIVTREKRFDELIEKHTMLPYYLCFLPLERRKKAYELLMAMDRKFYDHLYMRRNKTERRQYFRYCPLCAAADRERYGETYWHRKHQLTGIDICVEHRCRLENSSAGIAAEDLRYKLIHAETVIPKKMCRNFEVSDMEMRIADYVLRVFDAAMDFENEVSPGKFLHYRLEGTPYLSIRGEQIFARKLFADLSEFYQDLPQNTIQEWWYVQKLFCGQNFHTYDICLLAIFLNIPVEDLLHRKLPEKTLQQRFDEKLRKLRSQGMTQKQAAYSMGVSIHSVKAVEEKRTRSAQRIL